MTEHHPTAISDRWVGCRCSRLVPVHGWDEHLAGQEETASETHVAMSGVSASVIANAIQDGVDGAFGVYLPRSSPPSLTGLERRSAVALGHGPARSNPVRNSRRRDPKKQVMNTGKRAEPPRQPDQSRRREMDTQIADAVESLLIHQHSPWPVTGPIVRVEGPSGGIRFALLLDGDYLSEELAEGLDEYWEECLNDVLALLRKRAYS